MITFGLLPPSTDEMTVEAYVLPFLILSVKSVGQNEEKIADNLDRGDRMNSQQGSSINPKFLTAKELLTSRKDYFRISTGSKDIDRILGGGIEQGAITEFYGEYRTGKTQICLQLLLSVTLPSNLGGMGAQAVFIDTEGNFRPERIRQMCGRYEVDPMDVLDNIFVGKAYDTKTQIQLVSELDNLKTERDIRLLVIDSLTSNFRVEYTGESKLIERQQALNRHLNQLAQVSSFADEQPMAVVFTNQVIGNVNKPYKDAPSAVGGHIIAHASTHRIQLTRTSDFTDKVPVLMATLIDSPYLPEDSARFKITELGIVDGDNETTQEFKDFLQKMREKARTSVEAVADGH